ncbi:hypothetical protein K502DRAFT_330851 [Neoconidiobolus thromboides FSU 785]|nr:hypothetical protein K502DRAFT_330851 [Neoconidiobolus thromboides FSU 785]
MVLKQKQGLQDYTLIPELIIEPSYAPYNITKDEKFLNEFQLGKLWLQEGNNLRIEGLYKVIKTLKEYFKLHLQKNVLSKGYERVQYELENWKHEEILEFQYMDLKDKQRLSLCTFLKFKLEENLSNDILDQVDVQAKVTFIYKDLNLVDIQSHLLLSPEAMVLNDHIILHNMLPNQTFSKYVTQFQQYLKGKIEKSFLPSLEIKRQLIAMLKNKYESQVDVYDYQSICFNVKIENKTEIESFKVNINLNQNYPKQGLTLSIESEPNVLLQPQPKSEDTIDSFLLRVLDLIEQYILAKMSQHLYK